MQQPTIIKGGSYTDARGTLRFANEFLMDEVKRFYIIQHPDTNTIRAWQAHKTEQKWFQVLRGSFRVVVVRPDNWESPSRSLPLNEYTLDAGENKILHIPAGYANGFRALQSESEILIYADSYIEDAPKDDWRFPADYWYDWENLKLL